MTTQDRLVAAVRRRQAAQEAGDATEFYRALAAERVILEAACAELEETWLQGGRTIQFDPTLHPRDHGEFKSKLGGLTHGDQLHLPSGVTVRKTVRGFQVARPDQRVGKIRQFRSADEAVAHAQGVHDHVMLGRKAHIGGVPHEQGEHLGAKGARRGTPVTGVNEAGQQVFGHYEEKLTAPGSKTATHHVVRTDTGRRVVVKANSLHTAVPKSKAAPEYAAPAAPASPGALHHVAVAAAGLAVPKDPFEAMEHFGKRANAQPVMTPENARRLAAAQAGIAAARSPGTHRRTSVH